MYGAYVRWGMMCLWVGCAVLAGSLQPLQAAPDQPAKSAAANDAAGRDKNQTLNWGEIRIKGNYPEGPSSPGLLGDVVETLPDVLKRFEKAGQDADLNGLILRIESPNIGWGKLAEMRQAIGRVREKGKRVIAWMEGGSSIDYLLACSCDEIAMPESGTLMLLGVRAEVTFFKNLFDKLDIKPDVLRIGEYKSAAEPFTRTEMSDAFREEMQAMLDDYFDQIVTITAENRHLGRKDVEAAIDSGPHTARAALQLKLIDRLAYEDELQSEIERAHPDATFKLTRKYGRKNIDTDFSGFAGMVKMMNLLMGVDSKSSSGLLPKIAVINATGMIATGASESDLFGSSTMGSHTIVKAIREAREDSRVKAIVLRVDSPGGSALASDLMWRECEQIEQPFIASMGDVAASGGYYISMGADRILDQPRTLHGAIVVVGGKVGGGGLS